MQVMCQEWNFLLQVPSGFEPGFIYPASSLLVVTLHLAVLGTKKSSDVPLGPSKGEKEASLQHAAPWQYILGVSLDRQPELWLLLGGRGLRRLELIWGGGLLFERWGCGRVADDS